MIAIACILHYLIPENERFLPLRTYVMISLLILLFLLIFPPNLGLWGVVIMIMIMASFGVILSYGHVSIDQRRNQLQSMINMIILAVIGSLLAMNYLLIVMITISILVGLLWLEPRIVNKNNRPKLYQMVFQLSSITSITTINRLLKSFNCKVLDQKVIKTDHVYLDVKYTLSPLTQPLFMRQCYQLDGVKELIQY